MKDVKENKPFEYGEEIFTNNTSHKNLIFLAYTMDGRTVICQKRDGSTIAHFHTVDVRRKPKYVKRIKKASTITKWLEDNGYVINLSCDEWTHPTLSNFPMFKFKYCQHVIGEKTPYKWLNEWIEEVEVK